MSAGRGDDRPLGRADRPPEGCLDFLLFGDAPGLGLPAAASARRVGREVLGLDYPVVERDGLRRSHRVAATSRVARDDQVVERNAHVVDLAAAGLALLLDGHDRRGDRLADPARRSQVGRRPVERPGEEQQREVDGHPDPLT